MKEVIPGVKLSFSLRLKKKKKTVRYRLSREYVDLHFAGNSVLI